MDRQSWRFRDAYAGPGTRAGLGRSAGALVGVLRRAEPRRVRDSIPDKVMASGWSVGMGAFPFIAADPDFRRSNRRQSSQLGTDIAARVRDEPGEKFRFGRETKNGQDVTIRVTGTNRTGTITAKCPTEETLMEWSADRRDRPL